MIRATLLALLVSLTLVAPVRAASVPLAGTYLAQQFDSQGCAREPGGSASVNLTAWAVLGLVAAGRDAPTTCIVRHARSLTQLTDVELATLAIVAAGGNPRAVGGRDFVAVILRAQKNGRIGSTVASNQFGILALRAAGMPIPAAVRRSLLADQNRHGLWPVSLGGDGDSNLTASGISAARAAGVSPTNPAIRRALRALRRFRSGGGYAHAVGSPPDAQTTAWVLQALAAVEQRDPRAVEYLEGLQGRTGAIAYQRGLRITPVWVTAQSILGLAGRAFPLRP